jgi:MFS family permease
MREPTLAFAGRFGRKRFLMTCIVIFTVASAACGAATSLGMLVVARIVQGAGGGALQPIAQAVLMESFPPARRGTAMAAFAMGVIVAPILGPTLGGWITDNYSWRWVFYINLPVGAVALLMTQTFIEDPPYLRVTRHRRSTTWARPDGVPRRAPADARPRPGGGLVRRDVGAMVRADLGGRLRGVRRPELSTDAPIVNSRAREPELRHRDRPHDGARRAVRHGHAAPADLLGYPALQSGLAVSRAVSAL